MIFLRSYLAVCFRYYVNEKYQLCSRGHDRSMGSYSSVTYTYHINSAVVLNHTISYDLISDNRVLV